MVQWGVAEAKRLGLLDNLTGAGSHFVERMLGYDELLPPQAVEAMPTDMSQFVPGISGLLTITHPQHCQALTDAAVSAGATVLRGIRVTRAQAGTSPVVEFEQGGEQRTAGTRLIVGADGRPSAIREQFGVRLQMNRPRTMLAGLLVEGADGWDSSAWTIGTERDLCFAIIPMAGGRARLYGFWAVADRQRFIGADATKQLLAAFDLSCCPASRAIAQARGAGPLLSFLNNETWADEPFVDGGVLIGDAGGWTDPVIGCGLSSAYRDARLVSEILISSRDWSAGAFRPYAEERKERLRRLRCVAELTLGLFCEFGELGRSRRRRFFEESPTNPTLLGHLIANLAGPESQPAEVFTSEHREFVLGCA
jgi:2-polyprenyl-6-methoxyphenol hydroxylase-like FAD-dependent oxidoreductase